MGQIGAVAPGLCHSHSHARSFNSLRLGIEPVSLWILVEFVSSEPQWQVLVGFGPLQNGVKLQSFFAKSLYPLCWYHHYSVFKKTSENLATKSSSKIDENNAGMQGSYKIIKSWKTMLNTNSFLHRKTALVFPKYLLLVWVELSTRRNIFFYS